MKTPNYTPAIKKITDRLDAINCRYTVKEDRILLEFTMDDMQAFQIDVIALLDMEEIAWNFGADWESPSVICVYHEMG